MAKARAAALAAQAARKVSTLRKDFLDAPHWAELAHTYGMRLPIWGTPCTTGSMRRWLRKVGYSMEWYRACSGWKTLAKWIAEKPLWPMRAVVGLWLEERESDDYHAAKAARR